MRRRSWRPRFKSIELMTALPQHFPSGVLLKVEDKQCQVLLHNPFCLSMSKAAVHSRCPMPNAQRPTPFSLFPLELDVQYLYDILFYVHFFEGEGYCLLPPLAAC